MFHFIFISKIFRLYWENDKLWRNLKNCDLSKFLNYAYENDKNHFVIFDENDYKKQNIYYSEEHNKPIACHFMKQNKDTYKQHNTP